MHKSANFLEPKLTALTNLWIHLIAQRGFPCKNTIFVFHSICWKTFLYPESSPWQKICLFQSISYKKLLHFWVWEITNALHSKGIYSSTDWNNWVWLRIHMDYFNNSWEVLHWCNCDNSWPKSQPPWGKIPQWLRKLPLN